MDGWPAVLTVQCIRVWAVADKPARRAASRLWSLCTHQR